MGTLLHNCIFESYIKPIIVRAFINTDWPNILSQQAFPERMP